ncbi:propionyl-CoA--succinate CoA transferase [Thermoleophilia bacterium SCSIO 60948]|nr:propionyl-CoA--succinate CoA transferase [Thermoleophilia bacterium SCSIO 60948]
MSARTATEQLAAKRSSAAGVLDLVEPGADLIVGLANGEPKTVLDELEAVELADVRAHRMVPLRDRPYIRGERPGMRHVSWFLSAIDKPAFHEARCDLVPNNFSEVPALMAAATKRSLVLVSVSPPDAHGFFSLGTHAEYAASMIGEVPFFVEANARMPRTNGENQIHVSQVSGWCEADYPLIEVPPRESTEIDRRIAALIAERIPNGATLQAGIGSVPNAVLDLLGDHRDLGIHTELFSDGFVDLIESGAVNGNRKATHRHKAITTSVLGTKRLHDFAADNAGLELWPVDYTNDPRNIGREPLMNTINATLEVDFLGQCASESIGSDYWSSTGGQADYVRGSLFSENGQSFIVCHSTPHDESCSRIVPQLHPGAAVTSYKNIVDKVVTEHGVAELRGQSIGERTRRLIAIAHPKFRDELTRSAREIGYLE